MATPISPGFREVVVAVLAVAAVLGYALTAGIAMFEVWKADAPPVPSEVLVYFESGLAGLVGGIVAAGFGISPPALKFGGLSSLSSAGMSARQWIGAAYVIIYFAVGFFAAITWGFNQDATSGLVKNLAVIFAGMVIPIVGAWLTDPDALRVRLAAARNS